MLIDLIGSALRDNATDEDVLVNALPGGLHYGARASRTGPRPFGVFSVTEVERVGNSSGAALVTYRVDLTAVVDELGEVAGTILRKFHTYWDRLTGLTRIAEADVRNKLVEVHPGESEIGEADETEFGKDVMIGTTSWTMLISEHQPEL